MTPIPALCSPSCRGELAYHTADCGHRPERLIQRPDLSAADLREIQAALGEGGIR